MDKDLRVALKAGYLVETRAGNLGIVTYGKGGEKCISGPDEWFPCDMLTEDLRCDYGSTHRDIVRIYGYATNMWAYKINPLERPLIWERKDKKEMTIQEVERELGYEIKIVKERCVYE